MAPNSAVIVFNVIFSMKVVGYEVLGGLSQVLRVFEFVPLNN